MAGLFELFTDFRSRVRFRLLAPDGTVLAISEAYGDKGAAVAAITDVRECAGTGLIQDHCPDSPPDTPGQAATPTEKPKTRNTGHPAGHAAGRPGRGLGFAA
jgi:uncharacterized protein YegP (UPF0339 family)